MSWINLDLKAAETAEAIAKALKPEVNKNVAEKLIQNAASVLSHQGISAFFLYLKSQKQPWAAEISTQSKDLLKIALIEYDAPTFGKDLQKLIEGKQLLEQMLIYLRYHIKAIRDPTENK